MGSYGEDRRGGEGRRESGYRGEYRDNGYRDRGYREGGYGDRGRGGRGYDEEDRGFLDRAGDEVRSWFGDEEAQRRREADERRWEREQRMSGARDMDYSRPPHDRSREERGRYARPQGESAGTGWGNQSGESWNRDRPGRSLPEDRDRGDRHREESGGARWGEADSQAQAGAADLYGYDRAPGGATGYGGYPETGRRFDRIDPGSVGTHAAHPMSAPVDGGYNVAFGARPTGFGSSERYTSYREELLARRGQVHDPHYEEWRRRQIEGLDRDYDEYRREHQARFEQDFGSWRSRREGQRQALRIVSEHMEVVGSDGSQIGTVDKVRSDRIILTRSDDSAGGIHHSIPCAWVERVEEKVILNRSAEEARQAWRDEDKNRALFEREEGDRENGAHSERADSGAAGERRE